MKRIDIVSDTHGCWDDKYEYYLGGCNEIWHAGDVGSLEVVDKFETMRPIFCVVCGNIDDYTMRNHYRDVLRFKCENVDVLLKHTGSYPGRYDHSVQSILCASPPNLFVDEHSRVLKIQLDKTLNLLHTNPDTAGLRG